MKIPVSKIAIFFTLMLIGCSKSWIMKVAKKPEVDLQVLNTASNTKVKIYSILALKPSITKRMNLLPEDIREKSFFINMIEDFLLVNGYAVITNDFLINVRNKLSKKLDPSTLRNSEYAMMLDPEFVDAAIKINSLKISLDDITFYIDEDKSLQLSSEEELNKLMATLKEEGKDEGDDYCVYKIPYYEFEWSVELIHIETGRILSKSYQKASSLSEWPKSYKAEFEFNSEKECVKLRQNFEIEKFTSPELLKEKLVLYMNKALVRLFQDFSPSPGKKLTPSKHYDSGDPLRYAPPSKKKPRKRPKPSGVKEQELPKTTVSEKNSADRLSDSKPVDSDGAIEPDESGKSVLEDDQSESLPFKKDDTDDKSKEEQLIDALRSW